MIVKHYGKGKVTDITQITGDIQSEGDLYEVARRLTINVVREGRIAGLDVPSISAGEVIALEDDGEEIYYGFIWGRELDDNDIPQTLTCYDHLIYVMRSEPVTQVFSKKKPDAIIRQVCKEVGVQVDKIPPVDLTVTINGRNETAYNIIMMCCTKMSQATGKSYYPLMQKRKICIIEKGELVNPVLEYRTEPIPGTLLSLKYKESLDEMVNKIVVKDDKGKKIDTISNTEDIAKFGQVMKQYYKQKGENHKATAKNMLKGSERTVPVTCMGAWTLRTGYSVTVKSGILNAKFYIRSDTHHWSNGIHTTDLLLEFDNKMDAKDAPTSN